jgi:hypothetical protein
MTSRNLFIKVMKEDFKRRIWCIALFSLMFFVILPVYCALMVQGYSYHIDRAIILKRIISFLGPQNRAISFAIILSGIVCGLSSFFYLHSRKKVDLYHSIPVRREMLFASNFLNGFIIFFVPYIINSFISLVIINLNNFKGEKIITAFTAGLIFNTLFYCLIYSVTIVAVMLTGNIITSFLGTIVFLSYGFVLAGVKGTYFSSFFKTSYTGYQNIDPLIYVSPIGSYLESVNRYINHQNYLSFIVAFLITIVIVIVGSLFLYKKRPSEAAGNPMSFALSKPIIKFFLVIPISLLGGIILKDAVSYNKDIWLLFGVIFSLIVSYAIIQVIFSFDIRSAIHNKIQFLICGLITLTIVCIFRFDLLGYDTYLPKQSEIKSVGIYLSDIDTNLQYYYTLDESTTYSDPIKYHTKRPISSNITDAYSLVKQGIQNLDSVKNQVMPMESSQLTYYIKYNLKSGKSVFRKYILDIDDSRELVKKIYNNKEYKYAHYPIFEWESEEISKVDVVHADSLLNNGNTQKDIDLNVSFSLSGEKFQHLIGLYKEELLNLTYDELESTSPVVSLNFITKSADLYNKYFDSYYIYPSFTKTLGYLEECGFEVNKTVKVENVSEISINVYDQKYDYYQGMQTGPVEEAANVPLRYTDPKAIQEIMPNLIPIEVVQYNTSIINVNPKLQLVVNYKPDGASESQSNGYYFRKDKIPQFVLDDVKKMKK